MDARVRRIFLRFSTFPEECAADFWTENYGFSLSSTSEGKARLSNYERYSEDEFRKDTTEYFRYFYWQCCRYLNPLSRIAYDPSELESAIGKYTNIEPPGEKFRQRGGLPTKYRHSLPSDWLTRTGKDHNRRFAEVIFSFFLRSYFEKGALVDIPYMLDKLFYLADSPNPYGADQADNPLVRLGFSPDAICEYFKAFVDEISYHDGSISPSFVDEIFDIKTDGKFPVSVKKENNQSVARAEEELSQGYFSNFLKFIGGEKEGVIQERSHQVEENKLEGGQLPAIFEAQLNRQALADALNAVMTKEGLSEQKVADRTGFRKNDVNRARNGNATIDKTSEILTALGYPPTVSIPDLE